MLIRDRTTGTNIHRDGGIGNLEAAQLEDTRTGHSREGLLECLEVTALEFDRMARSWSDSYDSRHHVVFEWLREVRQQSREM
jgi:hypothetical protein